MRLSLRGLTEIPILYQVAQKVLTDKQLSERVIREGLQYSPGMRVLDVGCGPGLFAHVFDDADYLGIDISAANVDRAREIHPNKEFHALDATQIDSVAAPFDRVLVFGVFHHMADDDVRTCLGKMRRLVRPGGFCFVAEAIWPQNRFDIAGWALRKMDHGQHVRKYRRWLELFEPYGLREQGTYYNRLLPCMTCRLDLARA